MAIRPRAPSLFISLRQKIIRVKPWWRYTKNMTKWTKSIPSEDDEEGAFTDWLELQGYTHWHVPQETYTTSWAAKNKAKKLGVRRGVPDHWVIVPAAGKNYLVAIEMKREKGGTISDDQFEKVHELNKCEGVTALVAEGCGEAVDIVEMVRDNRWGEIEELKKKFEEKRQKRLKNLEKKRKYEKDNPF